MTPRIIDTPISLVMKNSLAAPDLITIFDPKHDDATPGHDGSSNNDDLKGSYGDDVMYGDAGSDVLLGDRGNDIMFGGSGNDLIIGGIGHDFINGGRGNDVIIAGDGYDAIDGGGGTDEAWGGAGNDTIQFTAAGQYGNFSGGTGADRFFVGGSFSGGVVIADFNSAEGDTLAFGKGVMSWNEEYYAGSWGMTHWFEDGSWAFVKGQTYDSLYTDMANGAII
jgi:Ca2+-binding RTX toxin-like protein